MATTSKVADELFALPKHFESLLSSAVDGQQSRRVRQQEMTAQLGAAASHSRLVADAADQANTAADQVSSKVMEMATQKKLLESTLASLSTPRDVSNSATQYPLAKSLLDQTSDGSSPLATALGEARQAEFYLKAAGDVSSKARTTGIVVIALLGIAGFLYAWYHRYRLVPLAIMFVVLGVAAAYPVYTMQLPGLAIEPLKRIV
jgi:cytochrome c1